MVHVKQMCHDVCATAHGGRRRKQCLGVNLMTTKTRYVAPSMERIGTFRAVTNGVWWGRFRDVFGARAPFAIIT